MRILRVSYRIPPEPGGKERHVECLTREQLRRGHQVGLAFRHGTTVPGGAWPLSTRPTALSRALALKSDVLAFAAETARVLPNAGPVDLLHLHGDQVEAAVLGPVCRRLGIPLVLTVHAGLTRRHPRFTRRALRGVGAFIALGAATARDLVSSGADPRRILTISSGLDLAAITKLSPPPARESGLVVSVGSLEPMKNHALLIEAIRVLRRDRRGLRLVIAGEGPEHDALRRSAGTEPVVLAGQLPRGELYQLVRRAQVFVLASRRLPHKGEGVPTAALEALALGTPVVVSSDAALDPVVPDRGAYRTFASGSLDDLVGVLGSVLDDAAARDAMSALGRTAATALDWPEVTDRIERWYGVATGAQSLRCGVGR